MSQQAFIQRGLASAEKAKQSGVYVPVEKVLAQLAQKLEQAKLKQQNS